MRQGKLQTGHFKLFDLLRHLEFECDLAVIEIDRGAARWPARTHASRRIQRFAPRASLEQGIRPSAGISSCKLV